MQSRWCDLTGLSAEVNRVNYHHIRPTKSTHARKSKSARDPAPSREKMLITHRGLSGPAILQVSSYWQPGEPISIDLAPGLRT
jgi:predicted flavoprotein YhiN